MAHQPYSRGRSLATGRGSPQGIFILALRWRLPAGWRPASSWQHSLQEICRVPHPLRLHLWVALARQPDQLRCEILLKL